VDDLSKGIQGVQVAQLSIVYNNGSLTKVTNCNNQPNCNNIEIKLEDIENYVTEDFFLNLHHLNYELDMLVNLIFNPNVQKYYDIPYVGNAMVESYRTHLRMFFTFFGYDLQAQSQQQIQGGHFDEARCVDYVDYLNSYRNVSPQIPIDICDITTNTNLTRDQVELLKAKLNLATEHLSYIRSEIDKDIREPGPYEILIAIKSICKKMDVFYNNILNNYINTLINVNSLIVKWQALLQRATGLPTDPPQSPNQWILTTLEGNINILRGYIQKLGGNC